VVIASEWVSAKIPKGVAEAIDRFLATDLASKSGVHSRSDFLTRLCVAWFSNIEKDFSIFDSNRISEIFGRTHPPPILPSQLPSSPIPSPPAAAPKQQQQRPPLSLSSIKKIIKRSEIFQTFPPPMQDDFMRFLSTSPEMRQLLGKYQQILPTRDLKQFANAIVEIVEDFRGVRGHGLPPPDSKEYRDLLKWWKSIRQDQEQKQKQG